LKGETYPRREKKSRPHPARDRSFLLAEGGSEERRRLSEEKRATIQIHFDVVIGVLLITRSDGRGVDGGRSDGSMTGKERLLSRGQAQKGIPSTGSWEVRVDPRGGSQRLTLFSEE